MVYDPKTNKYPYPEDTDKHYLSVKKNDGTIFDKNYPYVDKSPSFRFKQFLTRVLLYVVVFPICIVRLGLRVEGRSNLRHYRHIIKKGVVSCCNHVHMWDYIGIMCGVAPHVTNILAWAPNISGENGKMIRAVGGIPVPENDYRATFAFVDSVKKLLNDGGWLHIYAEGSMWEYYQPIRPFKRGVAYFSCKCNKPVIPLAYSYRKPGWIRRKIFKQIALYTLHIGTPIFKDDSLPPEEQEMDLTKRCHAAVCDLAGIDPNENIYEPIFNKSKRIDYYTKEYGVGYKGSW